MSGDAETGVPWKIEILKTTSLSHRIV